MIIYILYKVEAPILLKSAFWGGGRGDGERGGGEGRVRGRWDCTVDLIEITSKLNVQQKLIKLNFQQKLHAGIVADLQQILAKICAFGFYL